MTGATSRLAPCGVLHVSLDQPAVISNVPGLQAVFVVFWHAGKPVGTRVLLASELPVSATAVVALAAEASATAVARAESPAPTPPDPLGPPKVSVVVCTRDRPGDLRRCLAALARLTPPPAEVVVVDNAPTGAATLDVVATFSGVRYVRELRAGLSHARNTAVAVAIGDVIAFTDDDVEVSTDWLSWAIGHFANPHVACVTGLVLPADLSRHAACMFEFGIGGLGKGVLKRHFDAAFLHSPWWRPARVWDIGAGANLFVRKKAFEECGLFDPRLGAGTSGCSEDSEFWFRVLRAGRGCVYDPAVVVHHHHRQERTELIGQLRAYARGHVAALFVQWQQDRRPGHLIRVLLTLPWHYMKSAVSAAALGDRDAAALTTPQVRGYVEALLQLRRWLRHRPVHPTKSP